MVVEAQRLFGEAVTLVADEAGGAAVEYDREGALVIFVGNVVHLHVHEGEARRGVADHVDLLVLEVIPYEGRKAHLAAQRIAVGMGVAVDDDPIVFLDEFERFFEHAGGYSFFPFVFVKKYYSTKARLCQPYSA